MEDLKQIILSLFQSYLDGGLSQKRLKTELYKLEIDLTDLDNIDNKDLWFRFFKGDTLATTIADLDNLLKSNKNKKYALENLKMAIDNPKDFQVNFS